MQNSLDQFYTKPYFAKRCFTWLTETLIRLTGKKPDELYFIEPSAGRGDFFDILPVNNRIGVDIDSKRSDLIKADFLTWTSKPCFWRQQDTIVIGNPPFGHRANMSIQFFNRAADIADTIAFILPVQFRKFSVHRVLNREFQWIGSYKVPSLSFYTSRNADYEINTDFQIWTRLPLNEYKNMRLLTPPPISHPDFYDVAV